ncbi:MAG TPA: thioredoxin domain-containing protein [Acidobacteriota bacterium]|nr:thioredoxin domain-containing protein [Acidobacteriota bacterium]
MKPPESAASNPNRLIHEKSPYLLQHAYNPVDWYPWGDEAFERARSENRPIFLSIGYSTCHWCHVMETESFEDPEVAQLMNETFVSIKVDREERPDIDNIYMMVCQMTTGSGGWPLTIFLTPDKKPFYAGTYIPKNDRFGRPGMMHLIPRIKEIWQNRNIDVLHSADQITTALQQLTSEPAGKELEESVLTMAYEQLHQRYDENYGGFGSAPKFPTPHQLSFLLRYWKRSGEPQALAIVEGTLRAMRRGGIYDHLGFGIHRYSTDRYWLLPHFEKMLYDQALTAIACTEAYLATGRDEYQETADEIFTYVLRDMTSAEGGFYSAEDADSEGVEGKFYLWTPEELQEVLGEEDAQFAGKLYHVVPVGNFVEQSTGQQTGESILYLDKPLGDIALERQLTEPDLRDRIRNIREKLFRHREKRVHPYKDDKILTDWNGLMISALARAAQAFGNPEYANTAAAAARFILRSMRKPDGELLHRYREGEAAIAAPLDDYAFMISGLLDLYEALFAVEFLESALNLNRYLLQHFWDEAKGGFYFTSDAAETLLIRSKEIYDGAIPSGNSVAMLNLLRLSRMTGDVALEEKAYEISRAFSAAVRQSPSTFTQLLVAVDFSVGPSHEVVIAGEPEAEDTKRMLAQLRSVFAPNKVVLLRPAGDSPITRFAGFTGNQTSVNGKATTYVCVNYVCKRPVTDPA